MSLFWQWYIIPSRGVIRSEIIKHQRGDYPKCSIFVSQSRCPQSPIEHSSQRWVSSPGESVVLPRCTINLCKVWKLARSVKNVPDELPILEVLAGVDWNSREGLEAGCRAKEGVVPFRHKDAAGVRMEAWQYGIDEGRILRGSCSGLHCYKQQQGWDGRE